MEQNPISTKNARSSLPVAITAPTAVVIQLTEAVTRLVTSVIIADNAFPPF